MSHYEGKSALIVGRRKKERRRGRRKKTGKTTLTWSGFELMDFVFRAKEPKLLGHSTQPTQKTSS